MHDGVDMCSDFIGWIAELLMHRKEENVDDVADSKRNPLTTARVTPPSESPQNTIVKAIFLQLDNSTTLAWFAFKLDVQTILTIQNNLF